mgnify:FL=1
MDDLIEIIAVVESAFDGINLQKKTRLRPNPDAVKIYSYIADKSTQLNRRTIASYINRSHSSITIAIQRFHDLYEVDNEFRIVADYCIKKSAIILNLQTATYKQRIDIIFSRLSNAQKKELYVKATEMYASNNQFKHEIHYVS